MSESGAAPWVPESAHDLADLRTAARECEGCELHIDATQVVMGDGPTPARLMLVGEQPGDQEDRIGEPFVGPAGRLLDKALAAAGLRHEDVFVTNAVKHFRFATVGKRRIHKSPTRAHVVACRPWLDAELSLVRPEGVVLLGATAGGALYGGGFRIGQLRGRLQSWPLDDRPHPWAPPWVVPTVHPSSVLRSRHRDEDLRALVADLEVAADQLR
ncbi:UdgX family uracil-DNA binding protein [Nocardioides terrisoli]|uniref:UdgX family uracil-DNA binding protein n=1 Tax=Nocardioides terrisoli TaxID=3388267 RepID=UPI00287BB0E6|nr:UdgX family uracil-DNA binding protein [Nocardioides marmorisolisilvae]